VGCFRRPVFGIGRLLSQGAAAEFSPQEYRPRGRQVRRHGSRSSASREEGRGHRSREKALANSQAVKIRFLAPRGLPGGRRSSEDCDAFPGTRLQSPGSFPGVCKKPQRLTALEQGDVRRAIQDLARPTASSIRGSATTTSDERTCRPGPSFRPIPSSSAASSAAVRPCPVPGRRTTYGYFPPVYYYQGRVARG